jgi:hypothetical protein
MDGGRVPKGAPTGTWQKPEPVEDFSTLGPVLEQSFRTTRADGRSIGIVIAHPKLTIKSSTYRR